MQILQLVDEARIISNHFYRCSIEMISLIISVWQYHSNVSLIVMEVMLDLVGMMMSAIIYIPMVFIGCIGALILSLINSTVYAVVILKKRDL